MREFWIALLSAALIANFVGSLFPYKEPEQRNTPREYWADQTQREQHKAEARDDTVSIQIDCEPNCSARQADQARNPNYIGRTLIKYFKKTEDDPVAGFTFLLFIATLILARIAKRQIDEGRVLQRAYLSVQPLGIELFVSGDRFACNVGIKNSGNLPAREVSWVIRRNFSREERRSTFPIPEAKFVGNNIIPQQVLAIKGGKSIPRQMLLRYREGTAGNDRWLYVWGQVRYKDGFGKRRFTSFCHRYNLAALELGNKIEAKHARYHEHGNHTDEE